MENEQYKRRCFDKLKELYELYNQVRQAIILVENFDEERKMYIAPINQLRSALDHIFKAINNGTNDDHCDYELKEAKEHMDRAGYDALELLAGNIGIKIIKRLSDYDTDTLTTVFPEYHKEIKPKLTEIRQCVATLRSDKKINSEKSFSAYFDQITELIEIDKKVDIMIPSLHEYQSKKKREKVVGKIISFVLGLLSAFILYFITK